MKSFQDGDHIKDAIAIFGKNVFPEIETTLKTTVARIIEEISTHIQNKISKM